MDYGLNYKFKLFFFQCSLLLSIPNISKWNTDKVIDMNFMFRGCTSLISINFSNTKPNKLEKLIER